MFKKVTMFIALSVLALGLYAQVGEIRLKSKQFTQPLRVEKKSSSKLQVSLSFDKLNWKQSKEKDGNDYTLLWFEQSKSSGEVGSPQLPAYKKLILLPLGATANARITSSDDDEYILKDYGVYNPLIPVQPSVRKDKDSSQIPFVRTNEVYAKKAYAQNAVVSLEILGNMRSFTIARLVVTPVDYNPVEGKIKVSNNINIEIDVVGGTKTSDEINSFSSPYFDMLSKSMLSTASSIYDTNPDKTKYPVKMLIVSNRMFEASLAPFIQWKTQKGFKVITAYTDVIGTSSAQIKTYIQQQYSSATAEDPAPTFLVFVGDVDQVPSSGVGSQSGKQTDLYYASIDGDMFPEMYYGRLSATTTQQLDNIVNKILYYEKYQFASPEYLNKVTLIAGDDDTWNTLVGQPTIKYGTANYFNSSKGFDAVNEYGVTVDPNNPSVQSGYDGCYDAERIAVGFVNYTAHCSETSWQDPQLLISSVNAFSNTNNYPFTVANCCLSGDFGTDECIGEAWLRGENKGAVTYIGSSPSSYWLEDMYWAVGAFPMEGDNNGYVPTFAETTIGGYDAPFVSDYQTAGAMVFAGNLAVTEVELKDYPRQKNAQYYWEAYNILGDPSLMPYFTEATQNTVTHDEFVIIGNNTINISALEGTYIAVTNGSEILGTQYFDRTESKTVPIKSISTEATLKLTATRNQTVPFVSDIPAINATTAYLTLNSVSINDSEGNNNGKVDYGETVNVSLVLKNVGIANSNNTRVLIENHTGYATLTSSDSVFVGEVGYDDSNNLITIDNAFTFSIATNAPNNTIEQYTLRFKSDEGEWTAKLNLSINSPSIDFGDFIIDDSSMGNNNASANFGETFYGVVSIINTGNSPLNDISATFSIPDSIADELFLSAEPIYNISVDPGEVFNHSVKISIKPNTALNKTYPLVVSLSSSAYTPTNQEKVILVEATTGNVILMNNQSVSTCSSLFFDSGGESAGYAANQNYITTISSSTSYSKVKVSFSEFSLETNFDYLYVYDGSSTSSSQIAGSPFTGSNLPADIISSGSSLTFKFASNGSTNSSGWKATVSCYEPNAVPTCAINPYPANNSIDQFPNKLSWTALGNAQFYDVYLGNTIDNLAYLGRVIEPAKDVVLERNKDYYWKVIPGNYLGLCSESCDVWYFKTSNLAVDILMSNNEIVVVDSVLFYDSGGSGSSYQNDENYVLTFKPHTNGAKIKVEFISPFDVETDTDCGYDYLKIFNGPTTSSTLINKYCGTAIPSAFTSTSSTGELTFQFYTDASVVGTGWKAKITSLNTQTLYTLSINVKDAGLPVKGASVAVNGLIKITGADGIAQFSIPQGSFSYSVNVSGYSSIIANAVNEGSNQTIDVNLEKSYKTFITVLDNVTNQPILGAKVTINGTEFISSANGVANVYTKQGVNSLVIESSGYNSLNSNVTVTTDDQNFEFKLVPKEYSLTVLVKDNYGDVVSSALINVNGNSILTNSEGIASIGVPGGISKLVVSNSKFLTSEQWINVSANLSISVYLDYLQAEQRDVTFEIYGKTSLGVVVLNSAKLTLFRNGESVLSTLSTTLGRVKTRQIEGDYDYSIEKEGYLSKDKVTFSVGSGSVIIKDTLTNDTFEVLFIVKSNGNTLPGANVSINGYETQVTDANGIATFAAVGYAKGLQYTVGKDGYQTFYGSADITSDKTINVNLILTGIDDLNEDRPLIYPNPATDIVYVKVNSAVDQIQILSITGMILKQSKPQSNTIIEIPVGELTKGTYIVRIKQSSGKIIHSKLIKM